MSYSRIKFMLLSIFKMKLKRIALGSVIITNLLSSICTSILIMTWLNCCNFFWWFYCVDTKDTIFICFFFVFCFFSVCANYFQLLFVLIILEVWLRVCLELRFLIFFCFLLFHHHLAVACVLYRQIRHCYLAVYHLIFFIYQYI